MVDFTSLAPYHVLSYGTLMGTTVFQSFIGGIVAFRVLPRPQFSQLQQALFPIYFGMQTALPVIMALTYPGERTALGLTNTGISGFLNSDRSKVLFPIATIFVTGLANAAFVGPATTKVMRERKHQETRDGKKSYDPAPHSKEMQVLNKRFGRLHGASTLINMVAFLATAWYGAVLSERL